MYPTSIDGEKWIYHRREAISSIKSLLECASYTALYAATSDFFYYDEAAQQCHIGDFDHNSGVTTVDTQQLYLYRSEHKDLQISNC